MLSNSESGGFARRQAGVLDARLREPRRFIQVVGGPRQVGKTTLVLQVLGPWGQRARYASADEPALRDRAWLTAQWEGARAAARQPGHPGAVLAIDEIQKISGWSETVKALWDEDTRTGVPLQVVLLGSSPLLVQRGLGDSLAGRFEAIALGHWRLAEMREAFGFSLDEFLYFGGYPGAAPLIGDLDRWTRYVRDALVETTIARDVLLLTRVDKPGLLRQLFDLACRYSGQVLSFTKMLGQLQDAGNSTTLAHYLDLLGAAGMVVGLQKYSGSAVRRRGSIPKLQVLNTALLTALSGLTPDEAREQREFRGRLVESAVGAHLANAAAANECELFYWREGQREVDFVVTRGPGVVAIEVKSGRRRDALPGLDAFLRRVEHARPLLVGADGVSLEEFFDTPVSHWFRS